MKVIRSVALGLAALMLAVPSVFADVKLTMGNGRVTLVAKDATVRQILTEWARVGQAKIINLERIPGGPVSMELTNVPEAQALDVLLRSVAGYLAAPRAVDATNLAHFDRIVVMPTSAAPAPTRPSVATPSAPPAFVPPQPAPPAPDDGEEDRPVTAVPPVVSNRGPIFNPQQQPQVVTPQSAPTLFPRAPSAPAGGVAVPGMVAPPPQPAAGSQPGTPPPPGAGSTVE
jgi:hypothetical protein